MDPSETNQLFPALRVYLLSREKVERPHETQQRNRPGFVPGGNIQKRKWHSSRFPTHYFLGSPGALPLFNLRRRLEASNKIFRRGLKNRSIINQPLVLFCAKPAQGSPIQCRDPESSCISPVFVGAKKSPTCNWGVSSRVSP